jgi:chemotaxis protein CheX
VNPSIKQSSPPVVRLEPNWKAILEVCAIEVFEMMANTPIQANPQTQEDPHGEMLAMVGMAGALCGVTTIRCSKGIAEKLAIAMLGGDAESNPSMARDALGELCNMVAGNFKAKISNLADTCMLSVPTVIAGDNYSMEVSEPSDGVTVALQMDGQPIWVALMTHN